ncbi:MAG: hypothetical protein RL685_6197 [Pseudomonadota bacterium]
MPAESSPSTRYAEGANYSIDVEGALAVCRVRCRRDLTMEQGAQLASEKVALFRKLAAGTTQGMVFDLSAAPAVIGPKTQEALANMLSVWQVARKPIAIVSGGNALQQLQLRRLAAGFAETAAMFEAEPQARAWLLTRFR